MVDRLLVSCDREGTVYTRLGERAYGAVHVAEGALMIAFGKWRAPRWSLQFAMWGAMTAHRMREERDRMSRPDKYVVWRLVEAGYAEEDAKEAFRSLKLRALGGMSPLEALNAGMQHRLVEDAVNAFAEGDPI